MYLFTLYIIKPLCSEWTFILLRVKLKFDVAVQLIYSTVITNNNNKQNLPFTYSICIILTLDISNNLSLKLKFIEQNILLEESTYKLYISSFKY